MSGFRLGQIFGIDVRVHRSWLIIAALVLWSLTSTALPSDFPEIGEVARVLMAVSITMLFFLSLLAHELAHSVVALARGIPVRRITFFLFGGMAETGAESRSAREEFYIAAAGPALSFLLAGVFFALWYVGGAASWNGVVVGIAAYMTILNFVLGLFNLLPGFPMDGGRILRAVIWGTTGDMTRATLWAARVGSVMAMLLMGYGFWILFTGDLLGGAWLVLIGWFIHRAARASYRQHLAGRLDEAGRRGLDVRFHRGRGPFGISARWGVRGPGSEDADAGGQPRGRDVTQLGRDGG